MNTEINDKLDAFFEKNSLEDIEISAIKKHFKDILITNDYGSLVHAAIHHKYDHDKVLKFIKILFENGVDPNYRGKATGYSYIHLALYGYTDKDGKDYPYSTTFIKQLINLGKTHNLNVNIKDDDGDTIIHTALASEIYIGSIIELINELGTYFNPKEKDNDGNNIYEALLKYKKEAAPNNSWYNHLIKEEDAIKLQVEIGSYTKETIEEEIKNVTKNLDSLLTNLTYHRLIAKKEEILALKSNLNNFLKIKQHLTKENTLDFWINNYQSKITIILNEELKNLLAKPNNEEFKILISTIATFDIKELVALVTEAQTKYNKLLITLEESIKNGKNLNEIEKILFKVQQLTEKSVVKKLQDLIDSTEKDFLENINKIELLKQELATFLEKKPNENLDYKSLTKEEMIELINNYQIRINQAKEQTIINYQNSLATTLTSILEDSRFEEEILWDLIKETTSKTKKKYKEKIKGKKKNV